MFGWILFIHLLGAAVWTGGHLILAVVVLPKALREKSITDIQRFESAFEKIGIPALLGQVATGFWLAQRLVPSHADWFSFANPTVTLIALKLILLLTTLLLAADARLRVIPKLTPNNLSSLAWHIIPVTVVSVLFVLLGSSFRNGWYY